MSSPEFQVEKNVPVPSPYKSKGKEAKYPFDQMEIGDSFFVPCEEENLNSVRSLLHNHASLYRSSTNPNFWIKTRSVEGGIRVWRSDRPSKPRYFNPHY